MSRFQFHKGTIKTRYVAVAKLLNALFQFHKGTIKTSSFTADSTLLDYFNSIKVRLKHIHPHVNYKHEYISIP